MEYDERTCEKSTVNAIYFHFPKSSKMKMCRIKGQIGFLWKENLSLIDQAVNV